MDGSLSSKLTNGESSPLSSTPNRLSSRRTSSFGPRRPSGQLPSSPNGKPGSLEEGDESAWCNTIGRATLGKSGRVIERLMADIDRLKRELNSEIVHRQEVERREEVNKTTMEVLRAENNNLQQAKDTDANMLKRRDRKIEELKAELDSERARRVTAEKTAYDASQELDEIRLESKREVAEAREIAKHATGHAEVLEQSHKQLSTEYRQRTETFSRDLQRLTEDRDTERKRVKRLDVVVEQLKHEVEGSNNINKKLAEVYEAYREETETQLKGMREEADAREAIEVAFRQEMKTVVDEARWLINLGKNHVSSGRSPKASNGPV